jgi:hypothetical protein
MRHTLPGINWPDSSGSAADASFSKSGTSSDRDADAPSGPTAASLKLLGCSGLKRHQAFARHNFTFRYPCRCSWACLEAGSHRH